jgi:hypothetical protein
VFKIEGFFIRKLLYYALKLLKFHLVSESLLVRKLPLIILDIIVYLLSQSHTDALELGWHKLAQFLFLLRQLWSVWKCCLPCFMSGYLLFYISHMIFVAYFHLPFAVLELSIKQEMHVRVFIQTKKILVFKQAVCAFSVL